MMTIDGLEARKRELLEQKNNVDARNRLARTTKAGCTQEMKAQAQQLQKEITDVNRDIFHCQTEETPGQTNLPPCPFCGSLATVTSALTRNMVLMWFVVCTNPHCSCALRRTHHPGHAIKLWCNRVTPEIIKK